MHVWPLKSINREPHPLHLPGWARSRIIMLPAIALPSALSQLFIHSQGNYVLLLVIDIKGNTSSLSPLPVFPKGSKELHSNTPVTGIIPPCLCHASPAQSVCFPAFNFLFVYCFVLFHFGVFSFSLGW